MHLDPQTNSSLSVKLFKDVKNTKHLKECLITGKLNCCFIKPELILDTFQIVVAANKAATAQKLTTKNIYTEILFNLSITKNISKSLQTFGIDEKDVNLMVVMVNKQNNQDDDNVFDQIEGIEIPLENLKEYTDINLIKKTYKISENESSVTSLLDSIVSRIATKDFLQF